MEVCGLDLECLKAQVDTCLAQAPVPAATCLRSVVVAWCQEGLCWFLRETFEPIQDCIRDAVGCTLRPIWQ
jgi:hypothetical protein